MNTFAIPARDHDGYLLNLDSWNEAVAELLAQQEGIQLSQAHWEVLRFLRQLYAEFGVIPPMRVLVKAIGQQLGADKASSSYLMQLFTGTPIRIASKIAGLPKPVNCL